MSTQLLLNTAQRGAALLIPRISALVSGQPSIINRHLHIITQNVVPKLKLSIGKENNNVFVSNLLQPTQHLLTQLCGMKVKRKLCLRCKDCYFACAEGRWFVRCTSHPRHKQAQMVPKERNTWILTSVCQSKKRPWW